MADLDHFWHDLANNPVAQVVAFVLVYLGRYAIDRAKQKARAKRKKPRKGTASG